MLHRFRHPRAVTVLAAAQLVVGLLAAVDLVICREASGEVVVESALAGDCCDHGASPRTTVSTSADACACVDTPVVGAAIEVRHSRMPAVLPPVVLPFQYLPAHPAVRTACGLRGHPGRIGSSRLLLRNVVLLV